MKETSDSGMSVLELFIVYLYGRASDQVSVNDTRKLLFTQKPRSLDNILYHQQRCKLSSI